MTITVQVPFADFLTAVLQTVAQSPNSSKQPIQATVGSQMSCLGIRTVRELGFALLIACCATIAGIAQQNTPDTKSKSAVPGASGGQYAETDVCKTCHEEVWEKHFANTP